MLGRLGPRLCLMGIAKKHMWLEANIARFNSHKDVRARTCLISYLFSIF